MDDVIKEGLGWLVRWVLVTVIWELLLYGLGWATLYVCTAGRWPRASWGETQDNLVSLTGLGTLAAAFGIIALYNSNISG
jgi:hypothetical protein